MVRCEIGGTVGVGVVGAGVVGPGWGLDGGWKLLKVIVDQEIRKLSDTQQNRVSWQVCNV